MLNQHSQEILSQFAPDYTDAELVIVAGCTEAVRVRIVPIIQKLTAASEIMIAHKCPRIKGAPVRIMAMTATISALVKIICGMLWAIGRENLAASTLLRNQITETINKG